MFFEGAFYTYFSHIVFPRGNVFYTAGLGFAGGGLSVDSAGLITNAERGNCLFGV